jgi:hypothetical protein
VGEWCGCLWVVWCITCVNARNALHLENLTYFVVKIKFKNQKIRPKFIGKVTDFW